MTDKLKQLEWSKYSIFIVLIVAVIIASLISPNFMTGDNLINVLRQVTVVTILGYGAMTLIIAGMIDLSAGAVMAFAGVVSAMVYKSTGSFILAILAALVVGVACNLVSGFAVATLKVPAFIATLGMMMIARGAVLELTQGQNVLQLGRFTVFGQGSIGFLPIPALFLIGITIIVWYLMNHTVYGRSLYAVGGNEEAAHAAGIPVARIKYEAYIVNGLLVGIAGVIFMSRVNAGLPNAGVGFELQAIMAPVIGGTSFSGGVGTTMGALVGALIVGILNNIMNLTGVGAYIQQIIMGTIIIVAVAYDVYSKRGRKKTTILREKTAQALDDGGSLPVSTRPKEPDEA